jgi:hypothetical protein
MDADAVMRVSKRSIELCAAEGKHIAPTKMHWRLAQREIVGEDCQRPTHRGPVGGTR